MKTRKAKTAWIVPRAAFWIDVWEERDRLSVHAYCVPTHYDLRTCEIKYDFRAEHDCNTSKLIAAWRDDDARSMFEDGFFDRRDLEGSVYRYCLSVGLIREQDGAS